MCSAPSALVMRYQATQGQPIHDTTQTNSRTVVPTTRTAPCERGLGLWSWRTTGVGRRVHKIDHTNQCYL